MAARSSAGKPSGGFSMGKKYGATSIWGAGSSFPTVKRYYGVNKPTPGRDGVPRYTTTTTRAGTTTRKGGEVRATAYPVPSSGTVTSAKAKGARTPTTGQKADGARYTAAAKATGGKKAAPKSKPVPLGGAKVRNKPRPKPSVPAKNTGGLEKKSWGGWSPPAKVKPSKKTAAGVQRRSQRGGSR